MDLNSYKPTMKFKLNKKDKFSLLILLVLIVLVILLFSGDKFKVKESAEEKDSNESQSLPSIFTELAVQLNQTRSANTSSITFFQAQIRGLRSVCAAKGHTESAERLSKAIQLHNDKNNSEALIEVLGVVDNLLKYNLSYSFPNDCRKNCSPLYLARKRQLITRSEKHFLITMKKMKNNENRFPGMEYYPGRVEKDLYAGVKIIENLI